MKTLHIVFALLLNSNFDLQIKVVGYSTNIYENTMQPRVSTTTYHRTLLRLLREIHYLKPRPDK